MRIGPAGALACASHLEGWDFHSQEFYFYKTAPTITPDSEGVGYLRIRHQRRHRPRPRLGNVGSRRPIDDSASASRHGQATKRSGGLSSEPETAFSE